MRNQRQYKLKNIPGPGYQFLISSLKRFIWNNLRDTGISQLSVQPAETYTGKPVAEWVTLANDKTLLILMFCI